VKWSARSRECLLFGRTNSLFEKNDEKYVNIFRNAGLFRFLKTEAGGKNSSKNALLTCKRLITINNAMYLLKSTKLNHKHEMKLKGERLSLAAFHAYAYPTKNTYQAVEYYSS